MTTPNEPRPNEAAELLPLPAERDDPVTAAGREQLEWCDRVQHDDRNRERIIRIEDEARADLVRLVVEAGNEYAARSGPVMPAMERLQRAVERPIVREAATAEYAALAAQSEEPTNLPTRCQLCGGPHLSASVHSYEELREWEGETPSSTPGQQAHDFIWPECSKPLPHSHRHPDAERAAGIDAAIELIREGEAITPFYDAHFKWRDKARRFLTAQSEGPTP